MRRQGQGSDVDRRGEVEAHDELERQLKADEDQTDGVHDDVDAEPTCGDEVV